MPAGRPIYKSCSQAFLVLSIMSDGRAYCRPILRALTGLPADSLSPALIRNYRKGRVERHLNPHFAHSCPANRWTKAGVESAMYLYSITDVGIDALEREKAIRGKLGFVGFDCL